MKGFSLFVFTLFILMQQAQPEITVDVEPATPNDVVVIRVTVENPSTADTLWNNILRIAQTHPYFVPVKQECTLSDKIREGHTDIGDVTVQVTRDAEAGVYPVVITVSGGVGPCEEGCVPYLIEKEVAITVVRNEPVLEITHTTRGDFIVVTLKNTGAARAQHIVCNEKTLDTIPPGSQKEITIKKTDVFTVVYEDEYGKSFKKTYRISTADKETSVQVFLVGLGLLIVLKKRTA